MSIMFSLGDCCDCGCACGVTITLVPCISGYASSVVGATVTLRNQNSPYAVIATGTTDAAGEVTFCLASAPTPRIDVSGPGVYPINLQLLSSIFCGTTRNVTVSPKRPFQATMRFCNAIFGDWNVTITGPGGYSFSTVCAAGVVFWTPPELGTYNLVFSDPAGCMTTFNAVALINDTRVCSGHTFAYQTFLFNSGVCSNPCT